MVAKSLISASLCEKVMDDDAEQNQSQHQCNQAGTETTPLHKSLDVKSTTFSAYGSSFGKEDSSIDECDRQYPKPMFSSGMGYISANSPEKNELNESPSKKLGQEGRPTTLFEMRSLIFFK